MMTQTVGEGMKRVWTTLVILVIAGGPIAVQGTGAMAQPNQTRLVLLSEATQTPVPVALAVGQPVVVRIDGRTPTTVATTPPEIVDAILREGEILLIPLHEGQTMLSIGIGNGVNAKLALAVGTADGVRLITLSENVSATQAAATAPTTSASGANIETFVSGLSDSQRQALITYLQAPSLSTLSVLVQSLNTAQQQTLVDVLANRDALAGTLLQAQGGEPGPVMAAPAPAMAGPIHSVVPVTPVVPSAPRPQAEPGVTVNAPSGIVVHVIQTNTKGVLYLSYVLQNTTKTGVQADPHEIQVAGARGPVTVRQMDIGTPSEIAAGSMETGIIALVPDGGKVNVTWGLRDANGNALTVEVSIAIK